MASELIGDRLRRYRALKLGGEMPPEALGLECLEMEKAIAPLEPLERVMLREYYIRGKTWKEVRGFVRLSSAQTFRIADRALARLRRMQESP